MESKGYLAWSIILALLFSLLVHRVMSLWPDPNILEAGEEKGMVLQGTPDTTEKNSQRNEGIGR
jgi:hypothetical protein